MKNRCERVALRETRDGGIRRTGNTRSSGKAKVCAIITGVDERHVWGGNRCRKRCGGK